MPLCKKTLDGFIPALKQAYYTWLEQEWCLLYHCIVILYASLAILDTENEIEAKIDENGSFSVTIHVFLKCEFTLIM